MYSYHVFCREIYSYMPIDVAKPIHCWHYPYASLQLRIAKEYLTILLSQPTPCLSIMYTLQGAPPIRMSPFSQGYGNLHAWRHKPVHCLALSWLPHFNSVEYCLGVATSQFCRSEQFEQKRLGRERSKWLRTCWGHGCLCCGQPSAWLLHAHSSKPWTKITIHILAICMTL